MSISISPSVIVGTIGSIRSRRAPGEHHAPREQLLGGERDGQDVVDAQVECLELRLEIAAPGQAEHGQQHVAAKGIRVAEATHEGRAIVVVHVDDADVGTPIVHERLRVGQLVRGPDDE